MKDKLMLNTELELLAQEGEHSPAFRMEVYNGGKIRPKGFKEEVVVDILGIEAQAKVPIRFGHDQNKVIGHTEEVLLSDTQVLASGLLSRENDYQREVVNAGKRGFPFQASFGLYDLQAERVEAGETRVVNGKTHTGPFVLITSAKLREISVVDHGADATSLTQIAAEAEQNAGENKQELNMSAEEDDKKQEVEASAEHSGQTPDVIVEARKEQARKDRLNELAAEALEAGADVDQMEKLLDNALSNRQIDAQQFEHDCIIMQRPERKARRGRPETSQKVVEAALALQAGLEEPEKQFDEQTLNAADESYPHGLGLGELLYNTARHNGYNGSSRDVRGILQATFMPQNIQAASGFSTLSLPGVFSNVANKFLLEGFYAVEQAWDRISAKRNARDFKQMTSYRMVNGFTFDKVPAGGRLPHGELGEETYTNQVDTYGKMFAITRQDIINDDLGALSVVPRGIGRGGAVKLNKVFWDTFLDHSSFFTTGNNNLLTGAGSALDVDGLTDADNEFREQTDGNGDPLLLSPRILLVPSALRIQAMRLMNSTELRGMSDEAGVFNPHAGAYDLVHSQYLNSDSRKAHYLLANPAELPLIEVAFLNGQRAPTVEQADADFSTLGIQMRGFWDFGVSLQDHRAGVKSTGEA